MTWDSIQQVLRIVANAAGGVLVGKGYFTEDMWQVFTGGVISLGSVAWWFFWEKNRAV